MKRRLLVIGAGPLQVPAIEVGQRMGLEVVATDLNAHAPGASLADHFFPISTVDVEGTLAVARENRIDGVLTLATDFPMRTVAEVARQLGLPGISPDAARAATDKHLMRERWAEAGVPSPRSALVEAAAEALAWAEDAGFPVVLKPTDRSGSAGVSLACAAQEVEAAFAHARQESREGRVLVEEYVVGHEVSVETMCYEGDFQVVAITDKLTTGAPFFVELGHCVPWAPNGVTPELVCETARRASQALGVDHGPTHTEMMIQPGRTMVIELGARLGGDRIASHLVPMAIGADLVEATIRVTLGERPDLGPPQQRAACIRYLTATPGEVVDVRGVEEAHCMLGVEALEVEVQPGETARPVCSSGDRPGWVIATGESSDSAIARAEQARDAISIVTVPQRVR